jgi:MtrB/PioB family decaheme-associated outer membrane protein
METAMKCLKKKNNLGLWALVTLLTLGVQAQETNTPATVQAPAEVPLELKNLPPELESSVEVGAIYESKEADKFGEYNGKNESALNGAFVIKGGDGYNRQGGIRRFEILGTDLGATSRSINASVSDQGKWKLKVGYDQLEHHISDGFQTAQVGAMGSNSFYLPATFGVINYTQSATNNSTRGITNFQKSLFHTEEVYTDRKNITLNGTNNITPNLTLTFGFNHLDSSGAKLLGTGAFGGQLNQNAGTPSATTLWQAEANHVIMNPMRSQTENFDVALAWTAKRGSLVGSYAGSIFNQGYNSVNWQNNIASAATTTSNGSCAENTNCSYQNNSISTAPSNNSHQLNLLGSYIITPRLKMTGGMSFSRTQQNDNYHIPAGVIYTGTKSEIQSLPHSSLDAILYNSQANLNLFHVTSDKLMLNTSLKYNERNNKSPSDTFVFYNINKTSYTAYNTPYSHRKTQAEVAATYRLTKSQKLRLTIEREYMKRWCNGIASGAHCVSNPKSTEDKAGLTYKFNLKEGLSFTTGYNYSKKKSELDNTYINAIGETTATPVAGVNAKNYNGFIAYPYSSKTLHQAKAGVNWSPTDKLDLSLNGHYGRFNHDVNMGVKEGYVHGGDLDGTYNMSTNLSFTSYISFEKSGRDMQSGNSGTSATSTGSVPSAGNATPTAMWTNEQKNNSEAIGLLVERKNLLEDRQMDIQGNISYTLDTSVYETLVPYDTSATTGCSATYKLTCGSTPTIKNAVLTLKLNDTYRIDEESKINFGYIYQQRISEDYFYNGYQFGYTPNRLMPTGEQLPNYKIHVFTIAYNVVF